MRSLGRNLSKEAIVEREMEEDDEGEHHYHHPHHLVIFIITIIKIIVFNNTTLIREVATNGRSSAPSSLGRISGSPAQSSENIATEKVFRGWTDIGENFLIGLFFGLLSLFDVGSDSWSAWRLESYLIFVTDTRTPSV